MNLAKQFFTTENRTGCRLITVDAYNRPDVVTFYEKNGFRFLTSDDADKETRIMYFDLKRFKHNVA